jgi:hypothetical protein
MTVDQDPRPSSSRGGVAVGRGSGQCGAGPYGEEEEDKEDRGSMLRGGQGQEAMQQPADASMRGGGATRGDAR